MDKQRYDVFLQEATLTVRDIYEEASGKTLGDMETQSLNDLLDAFFGDKR